MDLYQRAVVIYRGPSGRTWQLQGPGQHAQPVALLRQVQGLYGAPLDVQTRENAVFRGHTLLRRRARGGEVEVPVDIHGNDPLHTARVVQDWLDDWPERGEPGWLMVNTPWGGWRSLQVYRKEPAQALGPVDPMAGCATKLLMVAGSEDPYPMGAPVMSRVLSNSSKTVALGLYNPGQVPASPVVLWLGDATTLDVGGGPVGQRVDTTSMRMYRSSLIDLAPHRLSVTDARGTKPIMTSFHENPALEVPPQSRAQVVVKGTGVTPSTVLAWLVPQFERLY